MLIDTHSHLNFHAYDKDRDEVIQRCLDNNVYMINVGTNYDNSKQVVEIAEKHKEGVYAAIGLHPINIKGLRTKEPEHTLEQDFDYEKYRDLAKSDKVVAIGEIGLDYWYKPKTKSKIEEFKNKQSDIFLKQLSLAKELKLPVILHCRKAHDDLIELLEPMNGVIHCFTGDWEQAKKYLDLGLYLGFNGIIYKMDLKEIIKKVPLNRILIETDSPFLTPPNVNRERNEPINVKYIAQTIAEIKGEKFDKIKDITFENTKKLFLKIR